MFGFFHFRSASMFTKNTFKMIDGMMDMFINSMDLPEFEEEEFLQDNSDTEEDDIITFESFNDIYILSIKLKGVDLKELSIKYENDAIDVNLDRAEGVQNYYFNNTIKKHYNKKFDNIEQIDTERLFKSMDNGYLIITMPKKYILDSSKIVDADFIEISSDNK